MECIEIVVVVGSFARPTLSDRPTSRFLSLVFAKQHAIVGDAAYGAAAPGGADVAAEVVAALAQVLGGLLVEGVGGVGLEEEELQADDDGVEVEHGLPVLAQDVEAHLALEVDVRVVDGLLAPHLGRLVRVVLVHREREREPAPVVAPLVRLDLQHEVEDVVRVREVHLHRRA